MVELAPGSDFFDYTIERLVGRGGFGAVYVARDRRLERRVALKILEPRLATDATARRRFIDESRLAASLDHPNIIPIYEAGEEADQLYLAMRYVPGPDLEGLIERDGAMPPQRATAIITQIASALDAAHAAGLVHRDIKPGNVLVAGSSDGTDHAYLTDFGLSKRVGGTGAVSQTNAGQFVGTVGYVAPEQVKGRSIDARADIYSLGCLAYHVLSGHQPYGRESAMGTILAHVEEPIPSLHAALPGLADRADPVLAKAMAKDPADRQQSAGAFAAELAAALTTRRTTAITRGFLFADLRGYTAFIERRGDAEAVRLLDAFRRLVRTVIASHEGAEIRTEGDSFYVVFPSASAAVAAGLDIVDAATEHDRRRPQLPLAVGIGVHAGETSEWEGGYVGSNVNIAARLCALAHPGEVLVSETVRTLIRTGGAVAFRDRGAHQLKGIDEPMTLWSAVRRDSGSTVDPNATRQEAGRPASGAGRIPVRLAASLALLALGGLAAFGSWLVAGEGSPEGTEPATSGTPAASERVAFSRVITDGAPVEDPCRDIEPLDSKLFLAEIGATDATPSRLTYATDLFEFHPAWTLDGTKVVAVGHDQSRAAGIYAIDHGGMREIPLADPSLLSTNNLTMSLSPDGSHIAWKTDERGRAFATIATDGSGGGVFVAGGDGAGSAQGSGLADEMIAVRYLPDGRLLSGWLLGYDATDPDWTWRFESMAPDGADQTDIGPVFDGVVVNRLIVSPGGDAALAKTTARASTTADDPGDGATEWIVIDLSRDDTAPAPIGIDAIDAGWTADGSGLLYVPSDAPGTLVERDLATGVERQVLDIGTGVICGPVARVVPADLALAPPQPGADGDLLAFERALLEPGRYRLDRFRPAMEATFGEGWVVRDNFVDGWSITHLDDLQANLSASRILVGLSGPCDNDEQVIVGSRPEDLIAWISGREDLDVTSPRQVTVGGQPGISVTVTPVPGTECEYTRDWTVHLSGDDAVWLEEHEAIELTAVDVGSTTVTFLQRAAQDGFDGFEELVRPVLSSLRFVDAP